MLNPSKIKDSFDKIINKIIEIDKLHDKSSEQLIKKDALSLLNDLKSKSYTFGLFINPEENDELYGDGLIMYGFACSGAGGANDEFVILFNNSLVPIDLSGFKIKYSAASGITLSNKFIFAENLYTIQPGRFVLISGKSYLMGNWRGDTFPDCVNTRDFGFSGTSGHVVITNADNVELDRVGYGSALKPEGEAVYNTSGGYYVHRNESCIDTNNNAVDFSFYDETGDGLLRNSNSLR